MITIHEDYIEGDSRREIQLTYQLQIERRAQKALARIPEPHQNRLIDAIRGLAADLRPPGAKKLSGRHTRSMRKSREKP